MAVEFCVNCKQSLPRGDLSFKKGQAYTSYDYACPHCGKTANPDPKSTAPDPEPAPGKDLVIRDGEIKSEGA